MTIPFLLFTVALPNVARFRLSGTPFACSRKLTHGKLPISYTKMVGQCFQRDTPRRLLLGALVRSAFAFLLPLFIPASLKVGRENIALSLWCMNSRQRRLEPLDISLTSWASELFLNSFFFLVRKRSFATCYFWSVRSYRKFKGPMLLLRCSCWLAVGYASFKYFFLYF